LDGDHCKFTTFVAFGTTFAVTIITDIGRYTSYRTKNKESGDTTYF